ncbi:MAG: tRNA lysidine(34) synthetase TilS [Boseongicola sp.]
MNSPNILLEAIDRRFGNDNAPKRLGVAVSGGSDSLALLHLLHEWGQADLSAVTVDHGLRPESAGEAEYVSQLCSDLGVKHDTLRWDGWDGKGNLQAVARRNRYALLSNWAKRENRQTICLGHTLDDQAETFLMRLARSAGVDGLSGMSQVIWRHDIRFDRPLLWERREALKGYLSARKVTWIDDPSNDDSQFERVKARQALSVLADLGISADTLGHTMLNLSMAQMALSEIARDAARDIATETHGDVIIDRKGLRGLNPEVQRRLIVGALRWVSSEDYPPRRDAVLDIEAAIVSGRNATLHGCLVMTSDATVRITREFKAVERVSSSPKLLWDNRWQIDGPFEDRLEVRALGEALKDCPDWRESGLPRQSLLASPAIWRGETLIAAPLAGLSNRWAASATGRGTFAQILLTR